MPELFFRPLMKLILLGVAPAQTLELERVWRNVRLIVSPRVRSSPVALGDTPGRDACEGLGVCKSLNIWKMLHKMTTQTNKNAETLDKEKHKEKNYKIK